MEIGNCSTPCSNTVKSAMVGQFINCCRLALSMIMHEPRPGSPYCVGHFIVQWIIDWRGTIWIWLPQFNVPKLPRTLAQSVKLTTGHTTEAYYSGIYRIIFYWLPANKHIMAFMNKHTVRGGFMNIWHWPTIGDSTVYGSWQTTFDLLVQSTKTRGTLTNILVHIP